VSRGATATDNPTVTVVIPCYNYGHYLEDAVRSALEQEGVEARVIIVDDASPDQTSVIAERLAESDARVSVVTHATNRGHIAAYNSGFSQVTTDYVTLVSADDRIAPGALRRALSLMERCPNVGMVYGPVEIFKATPPAGRVSTRYRWRVYPGTRWARRMLSHGVNPIRSPEAVVRVSVLKAVGDYNPRLPASADMEYWIRVALISDIGYVAGVPQAYYRVHGGNMHLTTFKGGAIEIRQRYDALEPLLSSPVGARKRRHVQREILRRPLTIVMRHLAIGRWRTDLSEFVLLADDIWPGWSESRKWKPLAQSLQLNEEGKRPTLTLLVVAWLPATVDRIRTRIKGTLQMRRDALRDVS
jgi:glycosyltransferase involved in cell wall biosynthesis